MQPFVTQRDIGYVSPVSRIVCGREQKSLGTTLPAGIKIFLEGKEEL